MRTNFERIWALFRGGRLDRELHDEIETHLAMQEEEFRRRGMDAATARLAARREFGGVAQAQEIYRDRRGVPWIATAAKDLYHALRGLRRNPGFTAAAVVSLALGIGANTAIFSLFHALMLDTLHVSKPEQLVTIYRTGAWGVGISSYPLYLEIARRTDLFDGVIARSDVRQDTVPRRFWGPPGNGAARVRHGQLFLRSGRGSGDRPVVHGRR